MDWASERYVRVYTRDTAPWIMLGWEARALFVEILRKADRAGVLEMGKYSTGRLAAFLGIPEDVVERSLATLLEDGCIVKTDNAIVIKNYIEAQEVISTPAARQRESRERRRDMIARGIRPELRSCAIYFIQSEDGGPIKIGHAEDVAKRLVQMQTSRPDKLVLLASCPGKIDDERVLQEAFVEHRVKGEWFSPVDGLVRLVSHVKSHGSIPSDVSQFVTSHSVPSVPCRADPNITRKKRAAPAVGSDAFEAFWQSFPAHRRVNKPAAIKAWPGDEFAAEIMAHVDAVKRKDNGEYIKQADRYLRLEMWKVPVFDKQQQTFKRWATPQVD